MAVGTGGAISPMVRSRIRMALDKRLLLAMGLTVPRIRWAWTTPIGGL